jgi:hypothetical protein
MFGVVKDEEPVSAGNFGFRRSKMILVRTLSITTRRDTARVSFGESGLSMSSAIVPHYGSLAGAEALR